MSYNATVKFQYVNDTEATPSKYFPEIVDQMTVTIEAPAQDLNVWQYYELFKSFLRSVGFQDYSIMEGACRLAFNDGNREDDMKKMMEEYELQDKQIHTDQEYYDLQEKYEQLKEQHNHAEDVAMHWKDKYIKEISTKKLNIDSIMPPWGHSDMEALQYTEEELNAMCDAAENAESCKEMATRELEWADRDKKPLACDKDDKSKECKDAWGKFWNDDNPKPLTYDEMVAEGYEMTADGFWIPSETKFKKWQLIPGSEIAVKAGCKCPVMDNAEMPDDRKWVNGDCPLHGKK